MKRIVSAVLTGVAALAALAVIQGCGVLGGPPTGVAVSAGPGESDSTVLVNWTTPAEGSPDKYTVYFRPVTDSSSGYAVLGETTATSYAHNPHGVTGQYKVSAVFGGESYEGADKPTTVPIQSEATLFEINADSSRCGFGWSRDSGIGRTYAMTESANCVRVDFYVSDLQDGVGGSLSIVSPNKADSIDSGAVGIVPSAAWRKNGFAGPSAQYSQGPLPRQVNSPANYFIYTTIASPMPCCVACCTVGDTMKHYALIQVDSLDVTSGRVWMKSWYQLVPELSLIRH